MAKTRAPYPPEFRRQMVELVRAGRSPEELALGEREELNQLRRENRQLRLERDILSKAAAWFARETNTIPSKGSGS
jgi:transposase